MAKRRLRWQSRWVFRATRSIWPNRTCCDGFDAKPTDCWIELLRTRLRVSDAQTEHPSDDVLRALVLGQLSDVDAPTVEAHLTECETCLERLDQLPTDSPLEQALSS